MSQSSVSQPVTVEEALSYEADGLEMGIEKCKQNITIFEDAIQNERNTIERYQKMIAIIEVQGTK